MVMIKNLKQSIKNFFTFKNLTGQVLHAQTLEFNHPTKMRRVSFKSNPPDDFKKMVNFLNKLGG